MLTDLVEGIAAVLVEAVMVVMEDTVAVLVAAVVIVVECTLTAGME